MAGDPRLELLEGAAKELGQRAGFDAGERLVQHFGGQRVFVPKKMRPRSRFWATLGPIAASELSKMYGGEHINVPTGTSASHKQRRRQIERYLRSHGDPASVSKDRVAEAFHVNRRTVQRVRAAIRSEGALSQFDLFDTGAQPAGLQQSRQRD